MGQLLDGGAPLPDEDADIEGYLKDVDDEVKPVIKRAWYALRDINRFVERHMINWSNAIALSRDLEAGLISESSLSTDQITNMRTTLNEMTQFLTKFEAFQEMMELTLTLTKNLRAPSAKELDDLQVWCDAIENIQGLSDTDDYDADED